MNKALRYAAIAAAATIVIGVAWNFGDLRRYLKVEMM
jgi:hypothetical protein